MRKRISGRKLSRDSGERKRLFVILVREILEHGQIVTTITKAKAVRPILEKLVTKVKVDTLNSLRRAVAATGDLPSARRLMAYGKLFATRPGGYTRIIRLGNSAGDSAEEVRLEFVEKIMPVQEVKTEKKAKPEKTVTKAAPVKKAGVKEKAKV